MLQLPGQQVKFRGMAFIQANATHFFSNRYGFEKVLLTTSCTDALEMTALLARIEPGDEVIMPSFTFVSTANAFVLRGAKIVFADSSAENPNIDVNSIESLITSRTKAIVVVHYAGIACDMDKVMELAARYKLFVIEDAAQAIDSYYKGHALGSIGDMAAFSFHETKNISCGEGGMLVVNDMDLAPRAEIIWEKGTNRAAFYRGEVDKYGWVDVGSSFLPSDLAAAYLYGQLDKLDEIQNKRKAIFNLYQNSLSVLQKSGDIHLPVIPDYASQNGHLFYLITNNPQQRDKLIRHLNQKGIQAVFHYLPLHLSQFYKDKYSGLPLSQAERYAACLLRLPFFYELAEDEIAYIADMVFLFYKG